MTTAAQRMRAIGGLTGATAGDNLRAAAGGSLRAVAALLAAYSHLNNVSATAHLWRINPKLFLSTGEVRTYRIAARKRNRLATAVARTNSVAQKRILFVAAAPRNYKVSARVRNYTCTAKAP